VPVPSHPLGQRDGVALRSTHAERVEHVGDAHPRDDIVWRSALYVPRDTAQKKSVNRDGARAEDQNQQCGKPIRVAP
jgi:hypothetical protein